MTNAWSGLALLLLSGLLHCGAHRHSPPCGEWNIETHVYRIVGQDTLKLDLRLPSCASTLPGIVFVHGGGFQGGRRDSGPAKAMLDSLAAAGISSASISYRLSMKDRGFGCDVSIPEKRKAVALAGEDLLAALDWLEAQSGSGWPEGWIAAGSSAGAETAMWAGYVAAPERWAGVLSFSGALESGTAQAASSPPLFAVHGTCDRVVPAFQAIHRECPPQSEGAWPLVGGLAWGDSLRDAGGLAATWAVCGGDHMVCNQAMLSSDVQDGIILWLRDPATHSVMWSTDAEGRSVMGQGSSSCPHPCN